MATGKEAELKTRGATNKATKKRASRKSASKPKANKEKGDRSRRVSKADGRSLGSEAFSAMGGHTASIIEQLVAGVLSGDGKSARMLVELAKTESAAMEALRHGPLRSQVLAWAAEPEWQDEVDPEKAETGSGSPEPG